MTANSIESLKQLSFVVGLLVISLAFVLTSRDYSETETTEMRRLVRRMNTMLVGIAFLVCSR